MFKSTSTSMIVLGILAVIVGIIAIAWPQATILALVILFAVYAFMDAGLQAARAFSSRSAGPVFGHLLLALISLAAGVVAVVWPGPTAYVLVIVVAAWALVGGVAEIFAGFQSGETAGMRAVHHLRPDFCRVRSRAVRAAQRRRGHDRAAVRPVLPGLRVLADRGGRPGPPAGQVRPAAAVGTEKRGLRPRTGGEGARTGLPPVRASADAGQLAQMGLAALFRGG